ncbi:hypothetical protein J2X04_001513 [Lysobacter niabensis]|uniref:Uncharacterized protein n=1 Tax=Agrilutibacter niabensis TaxID=380628 RepID=A0ABU1VNV1_9GAMM|nr:hypothetical protein [Lysobacter niabensis]MDR7099166.1 hypothetical protein [Lysobacter niabensis]
MQHSNNLTRARQIIEARTVDPETAVRIEQAIALSLLGPYTIARDEVVRPVAHPDHRGLAPMAATEAFAHALHAALVPFAQRAGIKSPKPGKYDPLFTTPTLFREVWRTRQAVDELGIPYAYYCTQAVGRWTALGVSRMPRPSGLTASDIAAHVLTNWNADYQKANRPTEAVKQQADMSAGDMAVLAMLADTPGQVN